MKRILMLLAIVAIFAACQKDEIVNEDLNLKKATLVGQHFNLNLIGVQKGKTAEMVGSNTHVIFVPLAGTTRIYLEMGDYAVLDGNATDGEGRFMLPDPGWEPYVVGSTDVVMSSYSIFVRPLGKPGGWSTITTCADLVDASGGGLFAMLPAADQKTIKNAIDAGTGAYCSVEQVGQDITMRTKGKTSWTNVTAQLTSIVFAIEVWIDENANEIVDDGEVTMSYIRVPIFDDLLENEYWLYENNNLKLLQVRFYPFGSNIADWDDPDNWNVPL